MSEEKSFSPPHSVILRVHYFRRQGDYDGFGIHVWGEGAAQETTWDAPIPFLTDERFGRTAEIPVANADKPISFIIHRGEEKDPPIERTVTARKVQEIWLKQGRTEIWTQEPTSGPEVTRAVIMDRKLIMATLEGPETEKPGCPPAARLSLTDHLGNSRTIEGYWCESGQVFVRPKETLDLNRNYFLALGETKTAARIAGHLLDADFFYEGDDLGATLQDSGDVLFKLWSPPATAVELWLYSPADQDRLILRLPLSRGEKGVWQATLSGALAAQVGLKFWDGCFYQYRVTAYGNCRRGLDPYAKSMAAFSPGEGDPVGKAAIVNPRKADPFGFREDDFSNFGKRGTNASFKALNNLTDFIGYELHVRDFTIDPDCGVRSEIRGTFRGLTSRKPLSYLKNLGVTHVQLMPVMAFYSDHESQRQFTDGRTPTRFYNWGYDAHGYFSLDGWFATTPADPYARIREMKEMVLAFHKARIGVVMDVVYNHIYDANLFENVAPGCYLRLDQNGMPSGTTGAGPSLETRRRMTRKLIVDSLRHFATEYGIDGFRFDLMEFLDNETLRQVRAALGDDILLHGEAWDFSDLPPHQASSKWNLPYEAKLAAFSDSNRDAYTGRMEGRGFAQGEPWILPRVQAAIIGNLRHFDDPNTSNDHYDRFAREPWETLNYLTIHDGYTLWDKLHLSLDPAEDIYRRARVARLAYAMLFTSQGRLILHGGDEFGRTKPLADFDPSRNRAHSAEGLIPDPDLPKAFMLHENSYASVDYTNMVRWGRLKVEPYASMARYVRDLLAMRKALPGFRMPTADAIRRRLHFLAGSHTPMPADGAGYTAFDQVPGLTLKFINGPKNTTCFAVGEIFPKGIDKNPLHNPFAIHFDGEGKGSLRFTRAEMDKFDYGAWSSTNSLQIKLILQPGTWWTPEGAYSGGGNNMIRPTAIRQDNSVQIDLAIRDHVAGTPRSWEQPYVAFEIDQEEEGREHTPYRRLVVVYNAGKETLDLALPNLKKLSQWKVLLDEDGFTLGGRTASPVILSEGSVCVPGRSVAVIGQTW